MLPRVASTGEPTHRCARCHGTMASPQPGDHSANENIHLSSTQPTFPRSPLIEEQLFHHSPDQPIQTENPILHLVPRTWNEFLELDQPVSGYYDYVDDLVVWCPHMANANHNFLGTHVPTVLECSQRVTVFSTPSVQVYSENGKIEWTANQEPRSSSQSHPRYGLYHPDFVITKARRVSDASSTTSRDPTAQEKIQFALPYTDTLLAVVVITSKSTRQVDFGPKWRAFARSGILLYVILDRGPSGKDPKQVIVGMRNRVSEADERSLNADKHDPPKNDIEKRDSFYRKVYKLEDKVDCRYFSKLDMTAAQLLEEKWMKRVAISMENDRRNQRRLAEEEKSKREKAERERDRLLQELEDMKQEQKKDDAKKDDAKKDDAKKDDARKDDAKTSGRKEGTKKNTCIEDKKTQRTRKASEVKKGSSSGSSPKTSSPARKKVRKQK